MAEGEIVAEAQPTDGASAHPGGRRFGYWAGHFVVVGSMIGAGILTTSGTLLRETGNPAALLGLWALGGVLALCGALTVAELARTIEIGELGAVSPAEYEALLSEIEAMPDDEVRAYLEAEEKRERN